MTLAQKEYAVSSVVSVLAKVIDDKTMARMLDCLLSCDGNPELDDHQAEVGQDLFDALSITCPDALDAAMRRVIA